MDDKYTEDTFSGIPVLPLRERPLFPETLTTLMIARPYDLRVINWAVEHDGYFVAVLQDNDDENSMRKVGTLVKISKFIRLPNNCIHLFTTTVKRVTITSLDKTNTPYFASGETLFDKPGQAKSLQPYTRILKDLVSSMSKSGIFNFITDVNITNFDSPEAACWYASSALVSAPKEFLQELLEETDVKKRITSLTAYISGEKEIIEKEEEVKKAFIDRVKNRNKEAIIREQIRALNAELGNVVATERDGTGGNKGDIYERAAAKALPAEYRDTVNKELEKLNSLDAMNPEYMLTKLYIETILDLPFSFEEKAPSYSILSVKEQLEKDHYGMKEVKERIVEFLASRLKAGNSKGAVICLYGPPGVGKTSVGASIARSLGRKFYRFSVGGMRDEAEIKGHRRTYVGAMPGKLIQAMKSTGVTDPVILIDEIDKMGEGHRGDPASALLEVLDPEQNNAYRDFYLDLPYDLSHVLFIVTANDISQIPRPLFDRMEIIEMSGYTPLEKLHIGKDYLIPDLLKKNGLEKKEFKIDDKALSRVAEEYAREAGVRQFKNELDKIMRKAALKILETPGGEEKATIKVKEKDLKSYLGLPPFPADRIVVVDTVGMAMGLAWTQMGGDVIPVEAVSIPEKGDMKVTGQLGDVMKESVSIAFSSVKHEAYLRGLDLTYFTKNSVHLHCPEGAVPKDGPSAGITLFSALWSMYRGIPAKKALAMTGELTLTGKVEAIGGLKEKILGARRNNIKEIIIPEDNRRDLEKLDDEVKGDVIFHTVKNILDVIKIAFPSETSERLNKIELERVNKKITEKEEEEKQNALTLQAEAFSKAFRWQ